MPTDIEISRAANMLPIGEIAARLGIPDEAVEPYGRTKAKISLDWLATRRGGSQGKLILVTAINPTPPGEGKTTTTVGLTDAMNRIGRKTMLCLREPSLGPCFGMKGGAAGGGYAQVVPMEEINLHFTGDFHAITSAHNLLAALIDNHIHWGNKLGIDVRRIVWKRVIDMNDRALRSIVQSLGGVGNGFPRESGFDITVASEIMAIFCLAEDLDDLRARLARIVIGYRRDKTAVTAADLKADGRDDRPARPGDQAQSRPDAREQPGLHPWRPVRQHRPWLQFGDRDQGRPEPGRLCRHRGRLRRRSRRREVLRHQVPPVGSPARPRR